MATGSLNETVSVTLDSSGNGAAGVGPLSARETWFPTTAHVSVSSDVAEAVCNIFQGDAPDQRCFRDATASGSFGDSTDRVTGPLKNPERVWAVWEGGDPGAVASLTVSGTKTI